MRLREILRLRSKSKKDSKLFAAMHRTGLFDAAYYLANSPDVAPAGIEDIELSAVKDERHAKIVWPN